MSPAPARLDCIYVAASARDARYTRICVASIRYFYPQIPIKLLAGGPLEEGLQEELARYWDVGTAHVRPGEWGWGFVKLELLFGRLGERFLVLDSDTVLTGDVLALRSESNADFIVDNEQQSEADTQRLYYDWRKVAALDPAARSPQFVFNSGQWFGTAGVITRRDFALLIDWSEMPPKLCRPDLFMPGDQGVLNYVLNRRAALDGLSIERRQLMRWPGHGMESISAATVAAGTAPPRVVHWAGFKRSQLRAMPGADVLLLFEKSYYAKLPSGSILRSLRSARYCSAAVLDGIATGARLFARRLKKSAIRTMSVQKA